MDKPKHYLSNFILAVFTVFLIIMVIYEPPVPPVPKPPKEQPLLTPPTDISVDLPFFQPFIELDKLFNNPIVDELGHNPTLKLALPVNPMLPSFDKWLNGQEEETNPVYLNHYFNRQFDRFTRPLVDPIEQKGANWFSHLDKLSISNKMRLMVRYGGVFDEDLPVGYEPPEIDEEEAEWYHNVFFYMNMSF